jgi:lipopolysaccharide export system permease protein
MPAGYRSMKEQVVEIRADMAASLLEEGNFNIPVEGLTVYIRSAPPGGDLRGILIHDSRDLERPRTYMAERGVMVRRATGPHLVLDSGTIQWMNEDAGELTTLDFDQYTFDLSPYMEETGSYVRDLSERYLSELFDPDITVPWVQRNLGRLTAEGHNRIASPLYALAFALIAYVAVVQAGFSRRGAARQVAAAVVAVILIRLAGFGVQGAAGSNPSLNPLQYVLPLLAIAVPVLWIAGWLPGLGKRHPPIDPPADGEAINASPGSPGAAARPTEAPA